MNGFLLDARSLAARYLLGPGLDQLDHLLNRTSPDRLYCLMFGIAEVVALLVRARSANRLTPTLFSAAMLQLRLDVTDNDHFTKLLPDVPIIRSSLAFVDHYLLSASDSVLLQTTLRVAAQRRSIGGDVVLVTPTRKLLKAARAEGLLTFNPEKQTTSELDALIGP